MTKLESKKRLVVARGLGWGVGARGVGVVITGNRRDACGNSNVLHPDCTSDNFLLVLHYSLARCSSWGTLSDGDARFPWIISCNYMNVK